MPLARLFSRFLQCALAAAVLLPLVAGAANLPDASQPYASGTRDDGPGDSATPHALKAGIERLRTGTWWEANRKIRPELAQVGDLMFLLPLADRNLEPSSDAIGRVQRLREALRSHLTREPAGWSRLVAQVRAQRVKAGDVSAVLLADALVNEVRYRDGTDGSYYPPARFFAESGVCKDFAVAKYLLLRDAGFDIARLRLVSLAPRYNNTPDDWHVILVVQIDRASEPLALDSPSAPPAKRAGDTANEASASIGPSALLGAILAGREPAEAVLRAPAGPLTAPLSRSGQARRPLATVFNELGSRSFERAAPGAPRRASAAGRSANAMYVDEMGEPWKVDGSGTFPKWRVVDDQSDALAKRGPAASLVRVAAR
ncbi:transglutaminase domain-containing protein [Paraburkholderia sp. UYCP14C]|uniref:transglutaminase-like domain-containing protein n=1 Tax=Paraburkholderia sp. UYCP14C TaxID=2511130 RepID=UPI00102234F7|nr:transglutaminase-like domain-containing protein [Paraburkholderia sp. UYCP14C]RZF31284.1 transglutaminase domain-containing protein [Paraburkholderia sp. UYCP14C]